MSNIKYVIRQQSFAYNDEYYDTRDPMKGNITAVYDDKSTAEEAYKQLIVDALYENELGQFGIVENHGYEQHEKIEAFILEKTGQAYDQQLPTLELDDAFEFAKLTKILHYQLIEIDNSLPNYVIFFPNHNSYFSVSAYGQEDEVLLIGNDPHFLFDQQSYPDNYYCINEHLESFFSSLNLQLEGSLEELSDTPVLLEHFIKEKSWLKYENQILKVDYYEDQESFDRIKSLNALLKDPIFEIRQVTLEELAKI